MGGHLPPQHGDQGLQLGVVVRRVGVGIGFCPGALVHILPGFVQLFPDQGGGGHAGHGCFAFLAVGHFGIFAQGEFHAARKAHAEIVDAAARRFHGDELPADGIGAARAGEHAGDACGDGFGKAAVHGVYAVDGPQLGGDRIAHFVTLVGLYAQAVAAYAQVAMGVDKAGQGQRAGSIVPFPVCRSLRHRPEGDNFSIFDLQESLRNFLPHHGKDLRVYDQQLVHTLSQDSKYLCFFVRRCAAGIWNAGFPGICMPGNLPCGAARSADAVRFCCGVPFCLCGKPRPHLLPPEESMLHRKNAQRLRCAFLLICAVRACPWSGSNRKSSPPIPS